MDKNTRLFKLSIILAIVGALLIFFNGHIANIIGSIWLRVNGGISDTDHFYFVKTGYANASLVIGGILFGVNSVAFLYSWLQLQE